MNKQIKRTQLLYLHVFSPIHQYTGGVCINALNESLFSFHFIYILVVGIIKTTAETVRRDDDDQ